MSKDTTNYTDIVIQNKENHTHLFCSECNELMINEKICRLFTNKNKIRDGDGCVINPKTINGKQYTRKKCYDCFKTKFGRKHKPLNTVHKDYCYLFDIEEDEIKKHLHYTNAITLENCIRRNKGDIEKGTKVFEEYCNKQSNISDS